MTTTVFGIGRIERESCGMGDSIEVAAIRPVGAYGGGGLPPLFTNLEDAQRFADQAGRDHVVIPLQLMSQYAAPDETQHDQPVITLRRSGSSRPMTADEVGKRALGFLRDSFAETVRTEQRPGGMLR